MIFNFDLEDLVFVSHGQLFSNPNPILNGDSIRVMNVQYRCQRLSCSQDYFFNLKDRFCSESVYFDFTIQTCFEFSYKW
jgi:hypothetical protein